MSQKTVSKIGDVKSKLDRVSFQIECADGTKQRFQCETTILQTFVLTLAGQSNFTIPKGDTPFRYRVLQADDSRNIAIILSYPGGKELSVVLTPNAAKAMAEAILNMKPAMDQA